MTVNALEINDLVKKFGNFTAVNGISLFVKKGEIFGLLGPNGAGKTTTINMILGLLKQTSGEIIIDGIRSTQANEGKIKNLIGLMTQETIVDGELTARENLELFCKLYHIEKKLINQKVIDALEEVDLMNFENERAGGFSGGMQRRLALVRSMIHDPPILILDEPTTGLDVQNRVNMWAQIRKLKDKGMTVIMTTQYLEEADTLCDRIAIIDHGKIKAEGTSLELKAIVGSGTVLEIIAKQNVIGDIEKMIKTTFKVPVNVVGDRLTANIGGNVKMFTDIALQISKKKYEVLSIGMHLPTLDDVFIKVTGSTLRDTMSKDDIKSSRSIQGRR